MLSERAGSIVDGFDVCYLCNLQLQITVSSSLR